MMGKPWYKVIRMAVTDHDDICILRIRKQKALYVLL
jgi:hypothetical protein